MYNNNNNKLLSGQRIIPFAYLPQKYAHVQYHDKIFCIKIRAISFTHNLLIARVPCYKTFFKHVCTWFWVYLDETNAWVFPLQITILEIQKVWRKKLALDAFDTCHYLRILALRKDVMGGSQIFAHDSLLLTGLFAVSQLLYTQRVWRCSYYLNLCFDSMLEWFRNKKSIHLGNLYVAGTSLK